jgi:aldehyde dehydrogenase (NAD+)
MTIRSFDKIYVGGRWIPSTGSSRIDVVSPHTERVIASSPEATTVDIDRAVGAARSTFDGGEWSTATIGDRIAVFRRFGELYAERIPELGEVISAENGSPISFANAAQAGGAWSMIDPFIQIAEGFDWESTRSTMTGSTVTVRHEPVGVVAAIVAWNVPQMLTMAKLAPALLAGCTVVLKPAPETPLDAYVLMEAVHEAGFPPGVVNLVPGNREAGDYLVRHPGVDKVAFTGSTATGRAIASICGEQLKRCSLELGGKSAAIVLDDADLDVTTEGLKFASLLNSGQACTNQTRILASRRNYDQVLEAVVESVRQMKVGDPADPMSEIGPLVSRRQQERVAMYIGLGQREGARVAFGGGGYPEGLATGWYVKPTVFAEASNAMRICQEEIFGPVVAVIPYDSIDDAVRMANDSQFGLAGSVWTTDLGLGEDVARRVRTGSFGINTYNADWLAPFGGYKASGIGREYGPEGMAMYTELKSIYPPPLESGHQLFSN